MFAPGRGLFRFAEMEEPRHDARRGESIFRAAMLRRLTQRRRFKLTTVWSVVATVIFKVVSKHDSEVSRIVGGGCWNPAGSWNAQQTL